VPDNARPVLIKLELYEKFVKSPQYKISQWEPRYSTQTDRQTDGNVERHNEANGIFSQLCKRAYKGNEKKASLLCEIDTPVKINSKCRGKFRFMLSKTEEGLTPTGQPAS